MSVAGIVAELKQNNEDFEFYPTTDEMIDVVLFDLRYRDSHRNRNKGFLDIGAGTCKLLHRLERKRNKPVDDIYMAIEKSKILISKFPDNVTVVGTDFDNTTLIDKPAEFYFCNPPYSQFENWTYRILTEGNFDDCYMVIPSRWVYNEKIAEASRRYDKEVLGSFDFLNAERQARAKVDIVKFSRKYGDDSDPFSLWFDKTFKVNSDKAYDSSYFGELQKREDEEKRVNELILSSENKAETLVNLYNEEMMRLNGSFSALCGIDEEILKDIGVNYNSVKQALKTKIENLKILYWKKVFENLDEITCRLTSESRRSLFDKFKENNKIDFNIDNIEAVVIWVIKHANSYYNSQLVDFFKRLSNADNVEPYKSNQRFFKKEDWGWDRSKSLKYTLSYRLIVRYYFSSSVDWNGEFYRSNDDKNKTVIDDIRVIARNLGFESDKYELVKEFGKKFYVYQKNGKPLFEYKIYQNGNTHLKLDIEFAKAMNVEVSRLLGWIHNKSDIKEEFPEDMAKGAEKYFNSNVNYQITNNNIKLLA